MCTGSERKGALPGVPMEGDCTNHRTDGLCKNLSVLLEFAAADDLESFKRAVEEEGYAVDESSAWYGRRIGSKKMGLEERTPLMVASMFGSIDVLNYILQTGTVDINRACGSDGATALHCAAAGGSCLALEIIKLLVDASADINSVDANGSRPADVIALCPNFSSKSRRKALQIILKGEVDEESGVSDQVKKEYPIDPSLPDIKNGIYSTDEFRMYAFKVKPCSRAYSHDWTECPFVHPGENARRRDPRKYHYSCVPCPEFKKGSCAKGDSCEYAHGIFECWLHPAQYRTRLCKDEINCGRRVCFFAHKVEELRPLYPSTGSAVPSPRSMSSIGGSPFDMMLPPTSTPPMTPTGVSSSPGGAWQSHLSVMTPPPLQLPGSRLKTSLNARNVGLEAEFRRQQLLEELAGLSSSPSGWNSMSNGHLNPTSLEDVFGSVESPTAMQIRHSMNQQQLMNSRSAAFGKRSQSFIDRGAVNRFSGYSSPVPSSPTLMSSSQLSDWGSPTGKLEWGIQGEELNKLRKSASFGLRNNNGNHNFAPPGVNSIGNSGLKDAASVNPEQLEFDDELNQRRIHRVNGGGNEPIPYWAEHYLEKEQMVA